MYAPQSEDKILDPFCGSGTTLVEAKLAGKPSMGVDINPLAVMISKSKVNPINKKRLEKFIFWLDELKQEDAKKFSPEKVHFFNDRLWFREDVLGQIEVILERIREISDYNTRNFVKVGLSSILKGVSNARMDRIVPTLPKQQVYIDHKHYRRVVNNLTRKINVFARLSSKLKLMHNRLELFLSKAKNVEASVYLGDARQLDKLNSDFLKEGTIKLVITSPPYWSAFNYQKIHKLSINLFKLKTKSFAAEIGQRNFLEEMEKVYEQISKLLTSEGKFCLIIGRSKRRIDRRLVDLGSKYDMPLYKKFTRKIKNHSFFVKGIKSEEILVFQKC
jgi:site-specific DNA-methyltransferase (cytosine-N4-specific)